MSDLNQRSNTDSYRWDLNSDARLGDISAGRDWKYRHLLEYAATLIKSLDIPAGSPALDAGCGVGFSTQMLVSLGYDVLGVDNSPRSICLAIASFGEHFMNLDISTSDALTRSKYRLITALMVFHCVQHLDAALRRLYAATASSGYLVLAIPHPTLHLQGKPYYKDLDFDYYHESKFEVPFVAGSAAPHPSKVPYYHRKVASYVESLSQAGYQLRHIYEPGTSIDDVMSRTLFIVAQRGRVRRQSTTVTSD